MPELTEDGLTIFCNLIKNFKSYTKAVSGRHQDSEMRTQKLRLLDHLPKTLQDVGGIEFPHGGVLEASHKLFKKLYTTSSRKRRSAMSEATRR